MRVCIQKEFIRFKKKKGNINGGEGEIRTADV